MNFTYDVHKARSNLNKHGISFSEAETVFSDPFALTFYDKPHSDEEHRFSL